MALATYSELKAHLVEMTDRDELVDQHFDNWLRLVEPRLRRAFPDSHDEVDATLTATPGTRTIALPTGHQEPIALFCTYFGLEEPLTPFAPGVEAYDLTQGVPTRWAADASSLVFDVIPDAAYTYRYRYRGFTSLSSSNPTTQILTDHPDLYLWALLVELYAHAKEAAAAQTWNERLKAGIEEATWLEKRPESLAPLSVDPGLLVGRNFSILEG